MNIYKDIIKNFFYLENNNKLFNLKINNIYFYQLIRMGLYYYIVETKNIYSPQPIIKFKNKEKLFYYILKEFFSFNRRRNLLKKKNCIIPHSRVIDKKDIYTGLVKKILNKSTIIHQTADYNFNFHKNSINYDYFNLIKKIKYFFFSKYKIKKNKSVKKLIFLFKKKFDLPSEFENYVYKLIKNKLFSFDIAKSLLQKSEFKLIVLVNSYANNHFIYAARQLKIKTIEIQHGVINKNHLGYNFPKIFSEKRLDAFPDKLIVYGELWKKQANFPTSKKNIIPLGFPNIEKYKKKKVRRNNRILIVSQQTIKKYLLDFVNKTLKKNKNIYFSYKAHPKENLEFVQKFLKDNKISKNIKIIKGNKNIYDLFITHKVQIGVFSTSIYEGYNFNLKTLILKVPGWESSLFMKKLTNVYFIKNYREFYTSLKTKNKKFSNILFKKNSYKNYLDYFKGIA